MGKANLLKIHWHTRQGERLVNNLDMVYEGRFKDPLPLTVLVLLSGANELIVEQP